MTPRAWSAAAHAYVAIVAIGIGYFIAGYPLQINDGLNNMIVVHRSDFWPLVQSHFSNAGFLRPLLWAQLDIAYTLAGGRYFEMFKTVHVVQVAVAGTLFVHLLRVRTGYGLLAAMFGVAVLFGSHTFAGTVVEGFPINTFLTIVICCLMAAALSAGTYAWWRDVAACALFGFAVLTVESGLLVWVCFAAAWIVGFRGVSLRGVIAVTALMAGYFYLRFGPLGVGGPALIERSSGFGFTVVERYDLVKRFGDAPLYFYAYNVLSQVLTVLFAEPKNGVFHLTRDLLRDAWLPRQIIATAASTSATCLIAWYAAARRGGWRRLAFDHRDRLVLLFGAVLAANAVISYPYTKDVIMSPAGAFYALAAAVAFGAALERLSVAVSPRTAAAVAVALAVVSSTWAVRLTGVQYALREKAFINRNDWAEIFGRMKLTDVNLQEDADEVALLRRLQEEAIRRRVPAPYFATPSAFRYFEVPW